MKGAKQLRDMIYSILENSNSVSGVTLKNSPNSSELLLDQANGKGRMTFHTLFPGLTLAFIFVSKIIYSVFQIGLNEKISLLISLCLGIVIYFGLIHLFNILNTKQLQRLSLSQKKAKKKKKYNYQNA